MLELLEDQSPGSALENLPVPHSSPSLHEGWGKYPIHIFSVDWTSTHTYSSLLLRGGGGLKLVSWWPWLSTEPFLRCHCHFWLCPWAVVYVLGIVINLPQRNTFSLLHWDHPKVVFMVCLFVCFRPPNRNTVSSDSRKGKTRRVSWLRRREFPGDPDCFFSTHPHNPLHIFFS